MTRDEVLARLQNLLAWLEVAAPPTPRGSEWGDGREAVRAAIALLSRVPDGERVREYERLRSALERAATDYGSAAWGSREEPDLLTDTQNTRAALDAFVLPLLTQPADERDDLDRALRLGYHKLAGTDTEEE